MRIRLHAISQILTLAAAVLSLPAQAQVTPGQVGDTLKRPPELLEPVPTPAIENQSTPAAPQPPAPAGAAAVSVQSFAFSGNTVFSSQQLSDLLAPYLNRPITLLDIYTAADAVTELYARNGYSLASTTVPPQKVTGGVIRLEVSEGRIGQIGVEPTRHQPERLQRFLGLNAGELYHAGRVESGMLRLNEIPGLTARALLRPGSTYGTSDFVIRVEETRVNGAVFVDNHGRESIGEVRTGALVNLNNPTGLDDQIQIMGLGSSGGLLHYGSLGYNIPLGYSGARLAMSYGYADFEVRDIAGLSGSSKNARIAVEYPLVVDTGERLNLSAGVADTRTSTDLLGTGLPGTSITVLELGATYNFQHPDAAITQVSTTLSTNFKEQERSDLSTGSDVRGKQLARLEFDLQHVQPLPASFSLKLRGNSVWSPDPLSDPSAYSIGGPQSVRGFPPSEVRGDRGYFGQLSLQYNLAVGAVRIAPRIFGDSGKVTVVDPLPGQDTSDSLDSFGAGIDLAWRNASLQVDASRPQGSRITSDGKDSDSTRVFGTLTIGF